MSAKFSSLHIFGTLGATEKYDLSNRIYENQGFCFLHDHGDKLKGMDMEYKKYIFLKQCVYCFISESNFCQINLKGFST